MLSPWKMALRKTATYAASCVKNVQHVVMAKRCLSVESASSLLQRRAVLDGSVFGVVILEAQRKRFSFKRVRDAEALPCSVRQLSPDAKFRGSSPSATTTP
jgi:hypothetical protein